MKKLLPQANTLNTVIRTFRYICIKEDCTLSDIATFNNFDVRQASYYANACYFLDLIGPDLKPTEVGRSIFEDTKDLKTRIYELIIGHPVIGKLYAKRSLLSKRIAVTEGKEYIRSLYGDYSEAVISRRTKCMIGWCEEVLDYVSKNHKNQ